MKKIILCFCVFLIIFISQIFSNLIIYANEVHYNFDFLNEIKIVTENLFGKIKINSIEYLYSLDNSPDYIYVVFENSGYAIYSSEDLNVLEYSFDSELPYDSQNKKYYAGPTNYFYYINNKFIDASSNKELSSDKVTSIINNSRKFVNKNSGKLGKITNLKNIYYSEEELESFSSSNGAAINPGNNGPETKYIDNYEYFKTGPYHGLNESGTCSAVAAQLLLGYHNYYSDRRIIDNKYLFTGEDGPNTCSDPMKVSSKIFGMPETSEYNYDQSVNNYFAKIVEKIPASSNNQRIKDGMSEILRERALELNIGNNLWTVSTGNDLSHIKNEIDEGRPIIVSMRLNEYTNHAVVCYGYQELNGTGTNNDGQLGYIVHYGWGTENNWNNQSNIWINSDWCFNWVDMNVSHEHNYSNPSGIYYECTCECGHRISDYPFITSIENNKLSIIGTNFSVPEKFTIPSIIDGYPVTYIATNSFNGQNNLISVKIPNSVEQIEIGAFSGCSNLEQISLPFIGDTRNSSLSFGHIFGNSSYYNSKVTNQSGINYYIPNNLTTITVTDDSFINNNAFENCDKIKEIYMPYGLERIGDSAFFNCTSLENIVIPSTVINIGNNAFSGCNNISLIEIPYSVSDVGVDAFPQNVNINWIYNPEITPEQLGITDNLTAVKIKNRVCSVNVNAFSLCHNLKEIIWYYDSTKTISDLGINVNNLITKIIVEDGVMEIKENSFKNCNRLSEVIISKTVSVISNDAFSGCLAIDSFIWNYNPNFTATELNINDLVTEVNMYTDVKDTELTTIKNNAFENCTKLEYVHIYESITSIYTSDNNTITDINLSFIPTNTLFSIKIPEKINKVKITKLDRDLFKDYTNLFEVNINGILFIGDNAFENCVNLEYVTSSGKLTEIGVAAFRNCENLANINISKSNNIKSNAFENCKNLTKITIPGTITVLNDYVFKNCTSLQEVKLSNQLETIGVSSFENCISLSEINLKYYLEEIGDSAFEGCINLTEISLGEQIISIGNSTFKDCTALEKVKIKRNDETIISLGENAFTNCSPNFKIFVPTLKYGKYINQNNWNTYVAFIQPVDPITNLSLFDSMPDIQIDKYYNEGFYCLIVESDAVYNFTSQQLIKMYFYNEVMDILYITNKNIYIYLHSGVYYYNFKCMDQNWHSTVICQVTDNSNYNRVNLGSNSLINQIYQTNNNFYGIFSYHNENGPGFYNFKVNAGNSNLYPEGAISIYSDIDCTQLIDRYNLNDLTLGATTKLNENELFVYLPNDGCYYINVILYNEDYSNITLSIENAEETYYDYSNSLLSSGFEIIFEGVKKASYFEKVTFSHDVKIEMDVYTNLSLNSLGWVYIFKEVKETTNIYGEYNYSLETIYASQIGSPDWLAIFTLILESGTYYFGYDNNMNKTSVNFAFNRIVNHDECSGDVLVTDPAINQGYVLGTEVLFNNGLYGATTITEGFTRNMYLMVEDRVHDPMSRLDYSWYSSDESKAMVTSYGTVLALPVEEDSTVTIYAIRKSDPSVIYYETFTILNDTEEDLIEIECNLSYSYSKNNGTYQLALNSTNCPYPMIQYYTWEVIDSGDETVTIGNWGHVTSTGITEALIVGTYELNPRVRLYINLNITEQLNNITLSQ